jgi:hypothetical protein
MQANIIIEYKPTAGYLEARKEVERIFEGRDENVIIDLLVPGWIAVKTDLRHKEIIEDIKERFSMNPSYIKATKLWIPVDYWCTIENIPDTVKEEYGEILTPKDRCFINIDLHNVDTDIQAIKSKIGEKIGAKLDDSPIDKILRIDIFTKGAALAMIRRHSIFQSA